MMIQVIWLSKILYFCK